MNLEINTYKIKIMSVILHVLLTIPTAAIKYGINRIGAQKQKIIVTINS
jgi:hypothetical protein